jgi:hypothetical protein
MDTTIREALSAAVHSYDAARAHLAQLKDALLALEDAGMYPSLPSETWDTRRGKPTQYLYMLFPFIPGGGYRGPNGKRKLYVGCKPHRIAEARRLASNRRLYDHLKLKEHALTYWLSAHLRRAQNLCHDFDNFPYTRLESGHYAPVEAVTSTEPGP